MESRREFTGKQVDIPGRNAAPGHVEVIAILRAGQPTLLASPEPDAPGFKSCPVDQAREDAARRQTESRNRLAALQGERLYDP